MTTTKVEDAIGRTRAIMLARARDKGVPDGTARTIVDFVTDAVPPGHFTRALLENDLRGVFERGDDDNLAHLQATMRFLYNDVPGGAHGSPTNVEAWAEMIKQIKAADA